MFNSFYLLHSWSLLGVKKSLRHAQISLLYGFNSKFPTSIPDPLICGVSPVENKFAMLIREPQDWGNYRKLHDRCRKSDTFDCKPRSFRG